MPLIELLYHQMAGTGPTHHPLHQIHEWLIPTTLLQLSSTPSSLRECQIPVAHHRRHRIMARGMEMIEAVTVDRIIEDNNHSIHLSTVVGRTSTRLEEDIRTTGDSMTREDTIKVEDMDKDKMGTAGDRCAGYEVG